MKSYLNINSLILVGVRKNYIITFYKGLNVIYGDSDTGKSSVLEFINYLLGASSIDLADEIKSSVNYASLEVVINDVPYTIVRDIYDNKKLIEVYRCKFNDKDKHFPKKYAPNYSPTPNSDGIFSEFLLDSLNFPKVEIKVSPSQSNSKMRRLSFRNIYKYVYINQDDIGSKSFLGLGNWAVYPFTKEVFKYMFNVLDESITRLQSEIASKAALVKELNKKYEIIAEFLRETNYETIEAIDDELNKLDSILEQLSHDLNSIDKVMKASSTQYTQLKDAHKFISLKFKDCKLRIDVLEDKIEKYSRLKNDYDNDINKIKAIQLANSRIGSLDEEVYSCPICESQIKVDDVSLPFEISTEKELDEELVSLIRRRKNINDMVSELSLEFKNKTIDKKELSEQLNELRELIDEESQSMITPFLTQRDALIKEISKNEKNREQLVKNLRVRNQQEALLEKHQELLKAIEVLNERLEVLKSSAPSMQGILQGLGERFDSYLKGINIKNRIGIKMSESQFIPVIRGKEYHNITSGGLRTISSIGYLLSILDYGLDHNINHPLFLIFDTVGKYLGKQTKDGSAGEALSFEDESEGMADPMKYQNIYAQLIDTVKKAQEKNFPCQIILVDNDLPNYFSDNEHLHIVAHYSSIGEDGLPLGLIDDI